MNYSGHSTPCYYPSATTKNAIIDALARDKQMRKEIEKICRTTLIDDLMQVLFVYLLEKPDELIIRLNITKQLKWYVIRIVQSQFNSNNSPYQRQHKIMSGSKVMDNLDITEPDWNVDELNKLVNKELDKLNIYDRKIFEMVTYSDKSCKELSKKVNIKGYSIWFTFNKVRKQLKNKIRKQGL